MALGFVSGSINAETFSFEDFGQVTCAGQSTPNNVFPKFEYANVSETCLINVPRASISALGDGEGPTATSGTPN